MAQGAVESLQLTVDSECVGIADDFQYIPEGNSITVNFPLSIVHWSVSSPNCNLKELTGLEGELALPFGGIFLYNETNPQKRRLLL